MRIFNEKSQITITARAINKDGVLFTPTNARYRVDDLTSRKELVAWTSLTAATSMTITLAASVNAIIDSSKKFEVKVLTVETDHGLSSAHPEEYKYRVKNLEFVS